MARIEVELDVTNGNAAGKLFADTHDPGIFWIQLRRRGAQTLQLAIDEAELRRSVAALAYASGTIIGDAGEPEE